MSKIQLINVPNELGAGTRGASLGYRALQIAALNKKSLFFNRFETKQVKEFNEVLFSPSKHSNAKYIDQIKGLHEGIEEAVKGTIEDQKFPLVIAGDHSNAAGTIKGIKQQYPDKRLGVIWIDAHADLHTPYTTPSGNVHGMPLGISLGLKAPLSPRNELSEAEESLWNELIGTSPNIAAEDLVFIGLRDTEEEEDALIKTHKIKSISVTEVRLNGFESTCESIFNHLSDIDLLYISFDVDSMDCNAVSYGTGTPVPGGFTKQESEKLLAGLVKHEKLCCLEITEINPTLDEKGNMMAETSLEILEKTCTLIEQFHG